MSKELFELVLKKGEQLDGPLHIIDTSDDYNVESFRVYHKDGYCFDVKKEKICEPKEARYYQDVDKFGFNYTYYSEWDGFHSLNIDQAVNLIQNHSSGNTNETKV